MSGECPAHRTNLKVDVTKRGIPAHRCRCGLQAGHPGDCEPADD